MTVVCCSLQFNFDAQRLRRPRRRQHQRQRRWCRARNYVSRIRRRSAHVGASQRFDHTWFFRRHETAPFVVICTNAHTYNAIIASEKFYWIKRLVYLEYVIENVATEYKGCGASSNPKIPAHIHVCVIHERLIYSDECGVWAHIQTHKQQTRESR